MLLKETAIVGLIGLRIPMLLLLGPRVVALDDEGCAVLVPLTFLTKNHLIGAMYFGVLCAGADLAAGLPAAKLVLGRHRGMKLVFGELRAEFLKRADGDVLFRNRDAARIVAAVHEAAATGERVTVPVEVIATVPKRYGDEPVARFTMSLSLKAKGAARAAPDDADRAGGVLH